MSQKYPPPPPGKKLIFRRWVTDPKTGERVYPPKGKKCFVFMVDSERSPEI